METIEMETIDVSKLGSGGKGWRIVPHNFEDGDKNKEGDKNGDKNKESGKDKGDNKGDKNGDKNKGDKNGDKNKGGEEGGVIFISEGGEYMLAGKTDVNRVVVGEGVACDIILDNCRICLHNDDNRSPFVLKPHANVDLHLVGDNMLTLSDGWIALCAEYNNRLTIGGEGWLTLQASSAIYGSALTHIIINGGRITAFGDGDTIDSNMLTINGGDVLVGKYGIITNESALTINGGALTVGGYIDVHNNMVVNGGMVTVKGRHNHYFNFHHPAIGRSRDKEVGAVTIAGGHVKVFGAIVGNPLIIRGKETVVEAGSVNTMDFGGATVRVRRG